MRDGGKGDKPRPLGVPMEQFDNNWDSIFKGTTTESFIQDVYIPDKFNFRFIKENNEWVCRMPEWLLKQAQEVFKDDNPGTH